MRSRSFVTAAVCVTLLTALASTASALNVTWQGAGTNGNTATDPADPTTQWNVVGNWSSGTVPTAQDAAYFTLSNAGTVSLNGGSVSQVIVDNTSPDAVLSLKDGENFSSANSTYLGNTKLGKMTQSGASFYAGGMYLGYNTGATGVYELSGGTFKAHDLTIGYQGTGTFTQNGGVVVSVNSFRLGNNMLPHGSSIYNLTFGTLSCLAVDAYGGKVVQSGGLIDGALNIRGGEYQLSGGVLAHGYGYYTTSGIDGLVTQTGGTVFSQGFYLGTYSSGTYQISDGLLSISSETRGNISIGGSGTSSLFTQTGGNIEVQKGAVVVGAGSSTSSYYNMSGGSLTVAQPYYLGGKYHALDCSGGTFNQTGGTVTLGGPVWVVSINNSNQSLYSISGGRLVATRIEVGLTPMYPHCTFNIGSSTASICLTEGLRMIYGSSSITAVPGSRINLTGASFDNQATNTGSLADLRNINFIIDGGRGKVSKIEAAGLDKGAVDDGYVSNFAMGTLTLGGDDAGKIQLVDAVRNLGASPEAVYVDTLALNAGATVDLNGLNLYYRNGGAAKEFFHGDAGLDGAVTMADLQVMADNWHASGAAWSQGDFNGDGVVDEADIDIIRDNWQDNTSFADATSSLGLPIPEPATITLLALGGLAMIRRRR